MGLLISVMIKHRASKDFAYVDLADIKSSQDMGY